MTGQQVRAVPLAVAAWLAAGAGWALGAPSAAGALLVTLLAVTLGPRWIRPMAVVALGAACAGAVGGVARQPPTEAVDHLVEITAQVRGPGKAVDRGMGQSPAVSIPVTVEAVGRGTRVISVDLPTQLFVDGADLSTPLPVGSVIRCHGRFSPRPPTSTEPTARAVTPPAVVAPPGTLAAVGDRIRDGLVQATGPDPPDAAALVSGIAIGDESRQTPSFAATMRAAGLSHLTAVSGGNFAIVMAAVLLVLRLLRRSRTIQVVGGFLAVSGYGALVGPQPSVLRAAAMAVVGLVGILSGGPARGVAALSSCVAALLLACPELAWSLGFALSVAATAGLLLLVTPVARVLPLPLIVAVPLAVAVAAHLATAPLLMLSGAPVSWVAVPANLLVSPCVAPITVLGLIGSLVAPVGPGAAGIIGHLALPFAQAVVVVAGGAQAVADSAVAAVAVPVVFGAGSAIGVWWLGARLARPRTAAVAAGAVLLVGVIVAAGHRGPPGWRLVVCDVGQGTAVLARTGVDSAVMFDTGPDGDAAASCAVRLHLRRLEAVVLSHFHADHVGGLPAVLSAYPGTPVMATTFTRPATMVSAVSQVAGVPAGAGEGDAVGWAGLRADALWPPQGFVGADSQANNGSLVAAVRWADGFSALIPGDVEPESQSRLMRSPSRPVDVVVIPHHGSDHQDPRFADWVSARVAIASVGAGNTYGHPAPATLQEYAASGAAVRRTDLDGCIAVGGAPGAVWVAPC